MNYQQTIEFLFSQLPMFSKVGASAFKNDLLNIRELCSILDHPEQKFPSIHIAGTNGKGSTSHMLSAILQQAGYKTGLYTSPHLHDFRERIRVNGEMIPEEKVVRFTERMRNDIATIQPSFFELTVAMAFEYFSEQKVDIAVIETGLGGRLDSTNIITPLLSVITNISYDHMNILGDTLQQIAFEKAGIIKPDTPVVISETQPESMRVFSDTADNRNAPIRFADREYRVIHRQLDADMLHLSVEYIPTGDVEPYLLDLPGHYQEKNLIGVLAAMEILQLKGFPVPQETIRAALANVKRLTGLGGRWEVIAQKPYTVLDVGHNEAGIRAIMEQLALVRYNSLHIVTGFVKDKDVSAALKQLPPDATYYFTKARIPRAMHESDLLKLAGEAGLKGSAYPDVPAAYAAALACAGEEDMVLVCGSVFIVGDVPVG